eukprot:scaffold117178_cov32-Prasinocladus_malaysianus.AAC.2
MRTGHGNPVIFIGGQFMVVMIGQVCLCQAALVSGMNAWDNDVAASRAVPGGHEPGILAKRIFTRCACPAPAAT